MDIAAFIKSFIEDPATALLLTSFAIAIVAAWKGWWVPRYIYDSTEARATKAETALGSMTEALKDLTGEIRQRNTR